MANAALPGAFALGWTAVFAVILIVHLWHVAVMTGRRRAWHGVHVLMAAGMTVMFAPTEMLVVPSPVGAAVFGVATVGLAVALLGVTGSGGHVGRLWLVSVVDLAAMAYMFELATFAAVPARLAWLTFPLVTWFVVQAAGWAGGGLGTMLARRGLGVPSRERERALVGVGVGAAGGGRAEPARPATVAITSARLHVLDGFLIRATLTLMALGMAYMLVTMQLGLGRMAGM